MDNNDTSSYPGEAYEYRPLFQMIIKDALARYADIFKNLDVEIEQEKIMNRKKLSHKQLKRLTPAERVEYAKSRNRRRK